jgi:hypothetical protein
VQGERVEGWGLPVDILIEDIIPETAFEPQSYQYRPLIEQLLEKGLAIPMKKSVVVLFSLLSQVTLSLPGIFSQNCT